MTDLGLSSTEEDCVYSQSNAETGDSFVLDYQRRGLTAGIVIWLTPAKLVGRGVRFSVDNCYPSIYHIPQNAHVRLVAINEQKACYSDTYCDQ